MKRNWKCLIGIHDWQDIVYVGLLTIRDTCTRCGLGRYSHGAMNEFFYRKPTDTRNDGEAK